MNITRHHYLEYFLLYIDDELDAPGRKAVETFIALHGDLRAELDTLKLACLPAEEEKTDAAFKNGLLRLSSQHLDSSNYTGYFLRYVDNELTADEKRQVETFVLQHPALQDEFMQWQQTILPREPVLFEDKHLLFKKEVRGLSFVLRERLAAAAILILVAGATWWVNLSTTRRAATDKSLSVVSRILKPATGVTKQPAVAGGDRSVHPGPDQALEPRNTKTSDRTDAPRQLETTLTAAPGHNISRPVSDQIVQRPGTSAPTLAIAPPDSTSAMILNMVRQPDPAQPELAAALTEPMTTVDPDQPEDKTISIGAFQLNRNKVRGLLKQASRMLSGKIKPDGDDGLIQVAAFRFNTKPR